MMLTCGTVLLLTCTAFFIYEYITYRNIARQELATLGEIVAANSTASLAFTDKQDAAEVLSSLSNQKHLLYACLYDAEGKLFATYPANPKPDAPPSLPKGATYTFSGIYLEGFQPVDEGANRLGMLYLKSDMKEVYARFELYLFIAFGIIPLLKYCFYRNYRFFFFQSHYLFIHGWIFDWPCN